ARAATRLGHALPFGRYPGRHFGGDHGDAPRPRPAPLGRARPLARRPRHERRPRLASPRPAAPLRRTELFGPSRASARARPSRRSAETRRDGARSRYTRRPRFFWPNPVGHGHIPMAAGAKRSMNVELMPIEGLPEFEPGADLAGLVAEGA